MAVNKTEAEEQKIEQRVAPSAHVIHDVVLRQGEDELERPASALAWSGLAAGMSMGFSLIAEGLLHAMLPNSGWRPLISKLGYSLGFLIVIVGKQQLFTENTLTPIIPLMHHKDAGTLGKVAKLWTAVFLANVLGTILVAWALSNTTAFEPKIQNSFMELAREALKPSFADKVLRGIFAGWLIALIVWILGAAKSEGIAIIIILTYIVGLGKLTHVIAGSVESFFLMWSGQISFWDAFGGYTIPALIGNTIGGVSLVAAVNHAQVKSGKSE
jgi:formate/nitrite transporter FocA (FNT family)